MRILALSPQTPRRIYYLLDMSIFIAHSKKGTEKAGEYSCFFCCGLGQCFFTPQHAKKFIFPDYFYVLPLFDVFLCAKMFV